jgi:sensor histidine kinase YesM
MKLLFQFILQVKNEVREALNFIDYVYQIFGFTYELKLSTVCICSLLFSNIWFHILTEIFNGMHLLFIVLNTHHLALMLAFFLEWPKKSPDVHLKKEINFSFQIREKSFGQSVLVLLFQGP